MKTNKYYINEAETIVYRLPGDTTSFYKRENQEELLGENNEEYYIKINTAVVEGEEVTETFYNNF